MADVPDTFTFKTVARCEIQADVFGGAGEGTHPVVVWIHGGALVAGNRSQVRVRPEVLGRYLAAGFVVVSIDYRLAPETKLPEIVADVIDAFAWVRTEGPVLFGADPTRVVAAGHSAGGYLALMTGLCVDPPPVAIASVYGYGDIAGPWYSRPDPFYCGQPAVGEAEAAAAIGDRETSGSPFTEARARLYLYYRQHGLWPREITGVDPEADPAAFAPWCPDRNVTAAFPPTILLHGTADTDVPHTLSITMAERLAAAGVEHELILIGSAPHGFDVKADWRRAPAVVNAFDRQIAFLKRHVDAV